MTEEKALIIRQNLNPDIWQMLSQVGTAFARAQKFGIHSPSEGAIKALFCFENGLPLTAARGLYIVNGKLGIESGIIAALLRRHPNYDYKIVRLDDKGCTIEIYYHDELVGTTSFTEDHAKRAGLSSRKTYQSYPEDMYFAKAITRAQRRYAPDVFMQAIYASEDMQEWQIIDVEAKPLPPVLAPLTQHDLVEKFGWDRVFESGAMETTDLEELHRFADQLGKEESNG